MTTLRAGATFIALIALSACGGDGTSNSDPVVPGPPTVATVTVLPPTLSLIVGSSGTLVATPLSATGAPITGKVASWSTSNPGVATVAAGVVTAVGPGTATVTAEIDGRTGSAQVTGVAPPLPNLLEIVSGNAQRGLTGRALADSIVVRARTTSGSPVAGAALTWAASSGTLSASTTATDGTGLARVQWTLGSGDGTVTVSQPGSAPLTITSNGRASGSCQLAPLGQRMTLGPTDLTLSLAATAPHHAVVLFMDFPDAPATETPDSLMRLVITPGLALMSELSHGRAQLRATAVPRWYRMSQPIGSYTWRTYQGHRDYIMEAMRLADPEVNFSQYDAVFIFTPPSTSQPTSPTFNGGRTANVVFDGVNFGNGVTFGRDSRSYGASVLAHETGHMFGLVDLYRYEPAGGSPYPGNQFRDVGAWSLMSNVFVPGHFFAWEKRKLGFLDASQVDCLEGPGGEEVVVQPVEAAGGLKLVALPLDASRALAIEVRSSQGIDTNLCARGVLIYEVNAAAASGVGPVQLRGSRVTTSGPIFTRCGPWADATYGVGPGEISTFEDSATGIRVQVLAAEAGGAYRVRVKR